MARTVPVGAIVRPGQSSAVARPRSGSSGSAVGGMMYRRISVGLPEENERLIKALTELREGGDLPEAGDPGGGDVQRAREEGAA